MKKLILMKHTDALYITKSIRGKYLPNTVMLSYSSCDQAGSA